MLTPVATMPGWTGGAAEGMSALTFIIALSGIADITIGDTICDPEQPRILKRITVDDLIDAFEATYTDFVGQIAPLRQLV
jgi:predicted membrane GTPase involved in stress response